MAAQTVPAEKSSPRNGEVQKSATADGINWIGKLALVLVVVQNTAHVLLMRYTRLPGTKRYHASVAVALMEMVKLTVCLFIVFVTEKNPMGRLYNKIVVDWRQTIRVGIPAFLYVMQNNVIFIAITEMDAPVFQILYQFKLITTAIFTRIILQRQLTYYQWIALCILLIGVMIVQSSTNAPSSDSTSAESISMTGLIATATACMLSGFAGVWFEKMLKQNSDVSVWIRNIQLAGFSLPLATIKIFAFDNNDMYRESLFVGFTPLVFLTILMGSAGGLIVAVAMKYADNVLKGFAASISVVASTMMSMFIPAFDFTPTEHFYAGSIVVLSSAYMYSQAASWAKKDAADETS